MEGPVDATPVDGRRARATRGKQRAVDAIVSALRRNEPIKSMSHLAELSGLSERTLFRYFGTQDGMFVAVAEHLAPATLPYLTAVPPDGPLEKRVRELAKIRCRFAREFWAMGRTVDRFVEQFDTARELRERRDAQVKKQLLLWLAPETRIIDKKTLSVVNEMMDFAFVDSMVRRFGKNAPSVLADNVLAVLRAGMS